MNYNDMDILNLRVVVALSRCTQSTTKKCLKAIKRNKLTLGQFAVLEMLYHKGDLNVNDIIKKSLSSIGNISLVIDNLVKLSFVEKKKCKIDKRITYVSITNQGKDLMSSIFPDYLKDLKEIMSYLDNSEKEILISLLKKLGKNNI